MSTSWASSFECQKAKFYLMGPCLKVGFNGLIQVNLCQKYIFLHQLTHNMTTDFSLSYKFITKKLHVVYTNCFDIQNNLCTQHVLSFYWTCNSMLWFNEQSFVILWVIRCKNKCFWKRFTCIKPHKNPSILEHLENHWVLY